ncbi:hypothetical protein AAEU28_14535 [Pseudoalteromonas sp. SS15]|uniref:hypothetical protein n=1 Tax=Pseudoalteromonas TaxID=53246 RepID=UPI00110BE7FD|nr:hypothetical protein [Pseudoalteromonas phenolica]TMO55952.1 hypothetical protein CWC21_08490 [Pseudoalteromonas phenolica]
MRKIITILTLLFTTVTYAESEIELKKALNSHFNMDEVNYEFAFVDLNNDGIKDAYVYLNDRNWCGSGGCTSFVFVGTKEGFKFQSKVMITKKPVLVSPIKNKGWSNLVVSTGGVGQVVLNFDGFEYPLNPSMQPKATEKEVRSSRIILK